MLSKLIIRHLLHLFILQLVTVIPVSVLLYELICGGFISCAIMLVLPVSTIVVACLCFSDNLIKVLRFILLS